MPTISSNLKYGPSGTYDFPAEQWHAAKAQIRALLISKARQRAMITYSELVSIVDAIHFDAHDTRLFAMLEQVSLEEHQQDAPLLSVLVVHKHGDMHPGPGFFEMAKALGRDTSNVLKAWIAEVQMTYQYWNTPASARR